MVQGISENNSHLLAQTNAPALGKYRVALHLRQFRRTTRKAIPMSATPKEKAKVIMTKIMKANVKSAKLRTKQAFDHTAFAEQMYKAQASPKMTDKLSVRAHAVKFGVVVDQRKVCAKSVTLNDKGVMRPELAVLAIMQTLQKFDKSLVNVGYVRLCVNGTPEASDMNNDDAYKVVLYRK